jgi:putative ABC transport system ATP-binding protein
MTDPLALATTHSLAVAHDGVPVFQVRDLVKVYETAAGGFVALDRVSFDVYPGEFLGIVGKSGAGKTTLLNAITGVSSITSGEVHFYPRANGSGTGPSAPLAIHSMNENQRARWRGRTVGIVYQSFELLPQLDLIDNITLPQDFDRRYGPTVSVERALELLDQVELVEHAYKLPAHVSGGQKQRVAIARALVNDPPVIVADEPTGNLDSVTAEHILQIFEALVAQGKTIIMVTHDRSLMSRFSRVIEIADGKVVVESCPAHIPSAGLPGERQGEGHLVADTPDSSASLHPTGPGWQESDMLSRKECDQILCAIHLDKVVKTYVNAAGEFPALKGIDLQIQYGQFVSLIGKSGSGKSTLLNMLTGIDHPTRGRVTIGGQDVYAMSESERALWRGQTVGIVFQFFQLLPTLTLLENVMLPMDYCDVYRAAERPERALALLEQVGLKAQAHKLPAAVSSGQQQSAAIARALATDPPIVVADEPTGNLDSRSANAIYDLFQGLAEQGKTILIVTHDPSLTGRTDQTVILADGEIIDIQNAN